MGTVGRGGADGGGGALSAVVPVEDLGKAGETEGHGEK